MCLKGWNTLRQNSIFGHEIPKNCQKYLIFTPKIVNFWRENSNKQVFIGLTYTNLARKFKIAIFHQNRILLFLARKFKEATFNQNRILLNNFGGKIQISNFSSESNFIIFSAKFKLAIFHQNRI